MFAQHFLQRLRIVHWQFVGKEVDVLNDVPIRSHATVAGTCLLYKVVEPRGPPGLLWQIISSIKIVEQIPDRVSQVFTVNEDAALFHSTQSKKKREARSLPKDSTAREAPEHNTISGNQGVKFRT